MSVSIERFQALDLVRFDEMLRESEALGYRFLRRMVDEWREGTNRFEGSGEALFVARAGERWIGCCGLNRDPYAKEPGVGRVRHLYVVSELRRCGVGGALLRQVVPFARVEYSALSLRAADEEAGRFFERHGFAAVQGSPKRTHLLDLRAVPDNRVPR